MTKQELLKGIKNAKEVYILVSTKGDNIAFKVSKEEANDTIRYRVGDDDDVGAFVTFGNLYIDSVNYQL